MSIQATYSVEDNKLRLYAPERFDADTYERVRAAGFKWAPKQALFVAPRWTPSREDLCIELAGDISAEQSTLVERAEAKAERFDDLSAKREKQSNLFYEAAIRISQRFVSGQPILVGHHSERKARKDQDRMKANMDKAVQANQAVNYWANRATGIEQHANRKAAPAIRARRIKTLLKELRERQRHINHAHICVDLWTKVSGATDNEIFKKTVEHWAGAQLTTGSTAAYGTWSELTNGKRDHREFVTQILDYWEKATQSPNTFRWISHLLNRLAYERSELGDVPLYGNEVSATVLQAFAREHGAHKPKAIETSPGTWLVTSSVPLPAQVADGCSIETDTNGWCELMQSCGYAVLEKKERRKSTHVSVPLINPTIAEGSRLQNRWNEKAVSEHGSKYPNSSMKLNSHTSMTQTRYSAFSKGSYSPYQIIELDETGARIWSNFKGKSGIPVCRIRTLSKDQSIYAPNSIVVIEDKPTKSLPIQWTTHVLEVKA